ncbi:cytochrome b/b6 domain-containing protein [Sulfurospirillum multivorans]|uniref:Cytochrome b/c n=2 Tax=Sulfurospirillum multivorans TaxID=66821 RepID=A0AA86ANA5_SULMK|nr:cytochrome b/b6 domain-containing protein [Sulfurospirillum multivorans]AHJ13444.1 putative cytochrome b/c [Sulfurospirillum multivorans DSM 12446]QEH06935.1 putative cytochrome b/c [Sulfurospirillum multivorans]
MKKILVWGLYTRASHALLMVMMLAVFLTPEVKRLLTLHVALGYTLALLFLFRILWGFMDVKYSQFKDFNFNLSDLKEYMFSTFGNKKEYIGHNPASSYAIIAMIVLTFLAVITGALTYGVKEGMGVFSFMNHTMFRDMKLFKEVHEFFSNVLMAVIFAHIAGVLLDKFFHKSRVLESMVDGYKMGNEEGIKLTLVQKAFGIAAISISIFAFVYMLVAPNSLLIADGNPKMDYAKENPAFYKECISCHTLFPPFLLPSKSWVSMMDTLENHFGDDASLDAATTESIKAFLVKNSAESSTKESSLRILASLEKEKTYLAITETPFWKNRHKKIDKAVYEQKEIGKPSNCKACHDTIENGLLNNRDIKRL